jgi:hypothetical protein
LHTGQHSPAAPHASPGPQASAAGSQSPSAAIAPAGPHVAPPATIRHWSAGPQPEFSTGSQGGHGKHAAPRAGTGLPQDNPDAHSTVFPWGLRFLVGTDPDLLSRLLDAFLKTLFAWQRRRGRQAGVRDGQTGAVTFVQRFAGNLRLNPHLDMVVPDGLFIPGPEGSPAAFHPLSPPTRDELRKLVVKVASRLGTLAERRLEQARTEAGL